MSGSQRKGGHRDFPEATDTVLLRRILLTLERMEKLLASIDGKVGVYPESIEEANKRVAARINSNTKELSEISLIPDSEPKD